MANLPALTAALPSFPTSAEIADNLRQAVGGLNSLITNYNVGGLSQTYLEAIAIALGSDASSLPNSSVEGAYEILNSILRAAYIATASGIYLDLKCADVGVYRKAATYATTTVLFVDSVAAPTGGTAVPINTVVSAQPADPTQAPIMFLAPTGASIPAGGTVSNAVAVLAISAGSSGNCDANTITTVESGGASSCYNPAKATGGADTEGDDTPNGGLRARGLAAILNASQGTLAAIAEAALSYNGITSAATADCTALTRGGVVLAPSADPATADGTTFLRGNVLVYCDDGTGALASSGDVNNASLLAFQADLNRGLWKAAGVTCIAIGSVLAPTSAALTIDVAAAYLLLGNTVAAVILATQNAVFGFINALPLGSPVLLAALIDTAKAVAGVSNVHVASVTINGVAADLLLAPQQVARCVHSPTTDIVVTAPAAPTAYS